MKLLNCKGLLVGRWNKLDGGHNAEMWIMDSVVPVVKQKIYNGILYQKFVTKDVYISENERRIREMN